MVWASLCAAAGLVLEPGEPVDLTLMLPDPAVIETRLESAERQDGGAWETTTSAWRVEVRPDGEGGYRAVWHDLDDPAASAMVIEADESLTPIRILNQDELLKGLTSGEDAEVANFLRGLPRETLSALLTRDLILAAYGQGTDLIPGERVEYRQPGGSLGDSGPLMMNASFTLESAKPGERAVVVWTSEVDPDEARKAMPGLIRDMFGLAGADADDAEKLTALMMDAKFEIRQECRYQIDVPTGLSLRTECSSVKDIVIGGERNHKETRLVATQRLID